jgi:hypothetical protein
MDTTARCVGQECLRESHGLMCNTSDRHEVVLGLLLQHFPLMSGIER